MARGSYPDRQGRSEASGASATAIAEVRGPADWRAGQLTGRSECAYPAGLADVRYQTWCQARQAGQTRPADPA